jgi:hypothetical protein
MDLSAAFLGLLQRGLTTMEAQINTRADGATWTPTLAAHLQAQYVPHTREEIPGADSGNWTVPSGVHIFWLSMVGQGGSGSNGGSAGVLFRLPILTTPGATFAYNVPGINPGTTNAGGASTTFGGYEAGGGKGSGGDGDQGIAGGLCTVAPAGFYVIGSPTGRSDYRLRSTVFGFGATDVAPAGYGGGGSATYPNGGPGLLALEY